MRNITKSATQHVEDTFNLADAILIDRIETQGSFPQFIAGMQRFLSERIQTLQPLKSLSVYGEDGFVIASSLPGHEQKVIVRGKALFEHHSAFRNRQWFFGPMIRNPLGADWVLTLWRRFDKLDGP